MKFEPHNILVLNFGQIGDVILSLPAMQAVRRKFPDEKITAMIGKSARAIVEMAGLFDEIICVDRVRLRDSRKLWSLKEIGKILLDLRRRKFDFVIDLHSLPETNLMGFVSGAEHRLFASRGNRSIDFLSNFRPKPPELLPAEKESLHITQFYLRSLQPLGIDENSAAFKLRPPEDVSKKVKTILQRDNAGGREFAGINLGAGNPSRSWSLEKFARLADRISENENIQVLVFYGPEERPLEKEIEAAFSANVKIYDKFNLPELAAAFSFLKVLIGNDTGPLHLGAVIGIPVVFITDPLNFLPLGENIHIARSGHPDEINVEDVHASIRKFL